MKPFHVKQQDNTGLQAHCDLREQDPCRFIKWHNFIECTNLCIKFSFNKNCLFWSIFWNIINAFSSFFNNIVSKMKFTYGKSHSSKVHT